MAQKQERLFARTNQLHPGTVHWPNPTDGTAHLLGLPPGAPLMVFDAIGRLVFRALADDGGTAKLQLTGLPYGIYTVRTTDGRTVRVVLQE
ncbi:MAG: T9SS type A sorting domain-containing protein [Hymenobacteraceae bacterium]|nr:T9SS type A sorting domain-containing protein [Hymenobacteraceae bacterium]